MAQEKEQELEQGKDTPGKPGKVAEYAVALSFSPSLKDTRSIDAFGVTKEGISGQLKLALENFYEKCCDRTPKELSVLEALGVFTFEAPLDEQEVQLTVCSTRDYGPGATVWFEFGGNYRIHAFYLNEGKEEYWMDVCVNRLTSEGYFPGIRG